MAREQGIDIHNYARLYHNASTAVERSTISSKNKQLILTYRDVCVRQNLCGNVRQWIVCGVGGAPDDRDRPREFSERGPIPTEELLGRLDAPHATQRGNRIDA